MFSAWPKLVIIFCCFSFVSAHKKIRFRVKALEKDVEELKKGEKIIFEAIDELENNMTMTREDSLLQKPCNDTEDGSDGNRVYVEGQQIGQKYVERLDKLGQDLRIIKNYLIGEKRIDIELTKKSESIVQEMDVKVGEANTIVSQLKDEVSHSLSRYQVMLDDLNTTSQLIPEAADIVGVLNYGGIGTPCSGDVGLCQADDSECRDGRCQCIQGLSYDMRTGSCTDSCAVYGTTYQTVPHWFIRGYNNVTFEDVTLADCRRHCEDAVDFVCRSFDYFPTGWEQCYLADVTVSEVDEDAWEYSSVGSYFQRDCAIDQ